VSAAPSGLFLFFFFSVSIGVFDPLALSKLRCAFVEFLATMTWWWGEQDGI